MASNAQIANLWHFQRGDGATPTEAFTEVPETFEVIPGAAEAPDIDVTHLLSTSREFRPGLQSFATFTVNMNYVPNSTVQKAMEDEIPTTTPRNYRIMDPGTTFGFLYSLTIATFNRTGFTVDGKIICAVTFKQSGKPTRVGAA